MLPTADRGVAAATIFSLDCIIVANGLSRWGKHSTVAKMWSVANVVWALRAVFDRMMSTKTADCGLREDELGFSQEGLAL